MAPQPAGAAAAPHPRPSAPPSSFQLPPLLSVLATLCFIAAGAVVVWTFGALSFRSDWLGLWGALSFYYIPQSAARSYSYYLHRAAAAVWSALIVLLLASVFLARAKYERFHRVVGTLVVICDAVNIVSGLTALIQAPFPDKWSTAFVSVNAGVNTLLIGAFVLSLGDRVVPRAWHPWLAFGFVLSPLGFLLQTNVFYVGCTLTSSTTQRANIWHGALVAAMVLSATVTAGVYAVYRRWYSTEALLPPSEEKKQAPVA